MDHASLKMASFLFGGFPKLGVPFWGSLRRILLFSGLYWHPQVLGNYHLVNHFLRVGLALAFLTKEWGTCTGSDRPHRHAANPKP